MPRGRTNPEFLNGVPELLMLRLLARKPMYGYQLVQEILLASNKRLEFGEGCIYPILHRLESQGALTSRRQKVGGRSRVIYQVTSKGKRKLAKAAARWAQVRESIELVLHGGKYEPSVLT